MKHGMGRKGNLVVIESAAGIRSTRSLDGLPFSLLSAFNFLAFFFFFSSYVFASVLGPFLIVLVNCCFQFCYLSSWPICELVARRPLISRPKRIRRTRMEKKIRTKTVSLTSLIYVRQLLPTTMKVTVNPSLINQ